MEQRTRRSPFLLWVAVLPHWAYDDEFLTNGEFCDSWASIPPVLGCVIAWHRVCHCIDHWRLRRSCDDTTGGTTAQNKSH